MSKLWEKTLSDTLIYDGSVVHLHKYEVELPDHKFSTREVIRHIGAVCILPLTEKDEVICVRQYRYPFASVLTELPAGKLDAPDEDPLEAARRELREETGAIAATMTPLGHFYPSPAILDEVIHFYLATGLQFTQTDPDDDEYIDIVKIPLAELTQQILDGKIPDAKTQAAVLKLAVIRANQQ